MTETKTTEDLKSTEKPPVDNKGTGDSPIEDKTQMTPIEKLPEDTQEYIKGLRKEAKDNRVSARTASEKLETLEEKFEELSTSFEEKTSALTEFEKKDKEAKLAEASEIEKLQIEIKETKKTLKEMGQAVTLKEGEITSLQTENFRDRTAAKMDAAINEAGYQFLPYQRAGLLQKVLEIKEDGTYKSSEEVIEIVQEFLEENKERPLSPPGGGGKERTTQPPSVDELKELIKIGKHRVLTTEEYARLNELQAELKKAMGSAVAV